jgi:predicted CopG family antitoxin
MKMVIDSNYFVDEGLKSYLQSSQENIAVLCEFVGIEAYKGNLPLEGISKTLSILEDYPQQVIILKGIRKLNRQDISRAGYLERMIDREQTENLSEYCKTIKKAKAGYPADIASVGKMVVEAKKESERSLNDIDGYVEDSENFAKNFLSEFSQDELKALKNFDFFSKDSIFDKIYLHTMRFTMHIYDNFTKIKVREESFADVINSVIFRNTLCHVLMILRWHINGSPPRNPLKVRNHIYDSGFVTFATYYDGLMSHDKDALQTYNDVIQFLKLLEEKGKCFNS